MPMMELAAGSLTLGLAPELGGSVAWFRHDGVDLMRPLSGEDHAHGNVLGVAMFPMMPYANRVADNCFFFGGREWNVLPNNPPDRLNVHGSAWKSAWSAEPVRGSAATLSLVHMPPDGPFLYRASQHFALTPDTLEVTLTLANAGPCAMPFGFGLHPWFRRHADTRLRFAASHFFLEGPDGIIGERLATPPELSFREARRLPATWRNNDYGGWDGLVEIWLGEPSLRLSIAADPVFGHLMLYADPEKPYFCLEPQTNAPCAVNHADAEELGAIVLPPGKSLSGSVRFTLGKP
ncbi:MAG: aldose 1-epimerase [Bauldia sp.]